MYLTIITIVKDDPKGLKSTLVSIRKHFPDKSIIVIDGSSRQDCKVVADEFNNVKYSREIDGGSGLGISNAFNQGMRNTETKFVSFVNAGDTVISAYPTKNLCDFDLCFFSILNENNELVKSKVNYKFNQLNHPGAILNLEFLKNNNLHFKCDFKVAMDFELWLASIKHGARIKILHRPIVKMEPSGISGTAIHKAFKEQLKAVYLHRRHVLPLAMVKLSWQIAVRKFLRIIKKLTC